MSERASAFYDDLAVTPDPVFDAELRQRLETGISADRPPSRPPTHPVEFEVPLSSVHPGSDGRSVRFGRSGTLALAAAVLAIVVAAIVVAESVDDSEAPASQVPAVTVPSTGAPVGTAAPTTTTVTPGVIAVRALLSQDEFDIPGFVATAGLPVVFDRATAEPLSACQPFLDTVFHPDDFPETTQQRQFESADSVALLFQYVDVRPTVDDAAAMLDGMQDPAFLDECVPAYRASLPTQCCFVNNNWFPIYIGEELEPPTIDLAAEDIWVRRYTATWTDDENVVHGPEEFAFAAIRVGRVVTSIEVMLTDARGREVATIDQFETIAQRMATRAADVQ